MERLESRLALTALLLLLILMVEQLTRSLQLMSRMAMSDSSTPPAVRFGDLSSESLYVVFAESSG